MIGRSRPICYTTVMPWQLLIAISVLLFSVNGLFHRILMKDESSDPYAQTIAFYGLGGMFAFVIAIFRGGFHYYISPSQIPLFFLLAIFATAAPVFVFKSLKLIESSENTILLSSQKLWLVLGAFIFLQESFSLQKLVGTLIILLGITIAQWRKQQFVLNAGVVFVVLAALAYAIGDIISFHILRDFDAASFTVYLCFIPVITLLILKPKTISKLVFYRRPKYAVSIVTVAVDDTLAALAMYFAYQVGRNAAQIAPITGTQTIISVLLAIVILRERKHMVQKIIGAIAVMIGVLLVL